MKTTTKPLLIRAEFKSVLYDFEGDLLSLAVLDLDHFKEINDTHGHAVGDTVLRSLEAVLLGSLLQEAAVARLAGDEYAVLLFDQPAESALIIMEEVRRHFSSRTLPEVLHKVQLSVGIACYPTHGSKEGLERAADEALYRAKSEGRGRVAIYALSKFGRGRRQRSSGKLWG